MWSRVLPLSRPVSGQGVGPPVGTGTGAAFPQELSLLVSFFYI